MCCVSPLSQYQLSSSTLFALEVPITCTRNSSTFFFAADLPLLSHTCCCYWGQYATQWPSCLYLLQGNICFARSAPLFVNLLKFTACCRAAMNVWKLRTDWYDLDTWGMPFALLYSHCDSCKWTNEFTYQLHWSSRRTLWVFSLICRRS